MRNLNIEIGQKIGQEITEHCPFIKPCFHKLANGDFCVFNGYVNGYKKVHKDFADKSGWHFLRRNVIVWNDCIKLRYGYKKEDCPVVWDFMEKYITTMAKLFKGFRLDNAHSTPIHVSEYLLAKAREVNPNILITAELFTEDINTDAKYVKHLGLNLLIREAIHCPDLNSMGNSIFQHSSGEILSINTPERTNYEDSLTFMGFSSEIQRWESVPIPALFYDCTHDNDPPARKRTPQDALPHAFLTAFTNCAISSTRGYDEFIPKNLSVVSEKRLYSPPDYSSQAIPEVTAIDFIEDPIRVYVEFSIGGRYKEVSVYGEWDNWVKKINLMPIDKYKWGVKLLFPKDYDGKELAYKYMADKKWAFDQRLKTIGKGTKINNLLSVSTNIQAFPGIYENLYCARKFINFLHRKMAEKKFDRIGVNQCSEDVMMVVRKNIENGESYVLIARSAFKQKANKVNVKGIRLPGQIVAAEFIGILNMRKTRFEEDKKFINGLNGALDIFTNFDKFCRVLKDSAENVDVIDLMGIPQTFVLVLKLKG
ncbi:unnamed protein product [Blepharisma stoltei]|uniref:Uncharacterized protein n=1 Tax=Blepharisma stoltei TaxID=1481888 RepID=A0AAU9J9K9_9CILI|nr:unnamed protein product [Blepharisma stoltei]